MARRSTRDMIIDVAARLFGTAGLSKTTMETIAASAGRGRRTVYMYFKNKAEIYEAVVEKEIRFITGPLHDLAASDEPFDKIIRRYSELRLRQLDELSARNPLIIKDFALGHSRVERLRQKLQRAELPILIPLFTRQIRQKTLSSVLTPVDYSTIFLNMLRGNDLLITKKDGLTEAIRLSAVSADIFLRGIASLKR
jgi:AcrR family transcriptional regulator